MDDVEWPNLEATLRAQQPRSSKVGNVRDWGVTPWPITARGGGQEWDADAVAGRK